MAGTAWKALAKGVALTVRLTPKSSRDVVESVEQSPSGAYLKVRVRAVPEDGAANRALCETIAAWLSKPKREVSVIAGATTRVKRLAIAGDPDDIIAAITRALEVKP